MMVDCLILTLSLPTLSLETFILGMWRNVGCGLLIQHIFDLNGIEHETNNTRGAK